MQSNDGPFSLYNLSFLNISEPKLSIHTVIAILESKTMNYFLTVFFGLVLAADSLAAQLPAKPNFIFINIDDLGYADIGPFGSTLNRTPNLDRMAKEGCKLTSFYAAPVCSPSRAALLTGCYPKRVDNPKPLIEFDK